MKRIIASAGMLALGIAGAKAAAPVASGSSDKPWSVSASLRSFYDDNYALRSSHEDDSFGMEFNPRVGVNINGQQTSFGASYSYTLRYFEGRPECTDHTHEFNVWLMHQFSQRYSIDLRDSLTYTEEPSLTTAGTGIIRTEGTVLHNSAQANFNAQITRLFGVVLGYRNELYDYDDAGYSAVLDRMEQYANIDLTWTVSPQTVFLTGYQFGHADYWDQGPLNLFLQQHAGPINAANPAYRSDIKNFYSHYFYVGVQHSFSPKLSVSLQAGVRYTDYYNLPSRFTAPVTAIPATTGAGLDDSHVGPYIKGNLRYSFLPGSYLDVGVSHDRSATDIGALDGESTLFYSALSHSFTPKFIGTLTGSAQHSDYEIAGGGDVSEWIYTLGLNLEYHFTSHLSGNIAYNFDTVDSDAAGREYDRNRIFMGITASY